MNKQLVFFLALCFLSVGVKAQQSTKFWIKLKDKVGTPYSVGTPTAFLTPKSIQRRVSQNIQINETDLPVTPFYVTEISNVANVNVLYVSKWLNAVAVQVTSTASAAINTATNAIASFSFVQNTEPVNRFKIVIEKEEDLLTNQNYNRVLAGNYYGGAYWQAKQLRVDCIHYHGFKGQGMTIAVLDAGFLNVNTLAAFDSLINRGGILGTRDFVTGGNSVYEDHPHGTNVLSCMAALVPSVMVGTAPQADYWLLRTEDAATETPSEEYNWIRAAEFSDSVGVDILTTSLGYTTMDKPSQSHTYANLNGKTYAMSIAATMAARKGMFVLNSAGNDGAGSWQYIGVPADADSICTVGAVDSLNNYATFSSKGPTPDGRIKPDLVAGGNNAYVATQSGAFGYGNGTSFSCPVLAGAVACFWQAHPTFNNMKVLDTLKHTASINNNPNNLIGWGIPNMCTIEVGLKDYALAESMFKVFPNPFANKVKIVLTSEIQSSSHVELFDVVGNSILKKKLAFKETELDLITLPEGVYFIQIKTNTGSAIQKIIKY